MKPCSCLRTVCSRGCFCPKSGALPDLASHTSGNRLLRREQESLKTKSSDLHWTLCPFEETLSHHPHAKQTNQSPFTAKANHRCLVSFQDVVSTLRNCKHQRESLRQPGWIERADAWGELSLTPSLSLGGNKGTKVNRTAMSRRGSWSDLGDSE